MSLEGYQLIKDIKRELRKRVPLEGTGTGFTTVADGYEIADIAVYVDFAQIARTLGPRAMVSKSKRARYLKGAVIVDVERSRKERPS